MAKRNLKRRLSEAQIKAQKWIKREKEIDSLSEKLTSVSRMELIKKTIEFEKERDAQASRDLETEFFFLENPEYFELAQVNCEKTGVNLYSLPGDLIKSTIRTLGLTHGRIAIENLKAGQVHPLALFTNPAGLNNLFKSDTVGYMIYAASILANKESDIRGKVTAYKSAIVISETNPQLIVHCAEMIRRALSLANGDYWRIQTDQESLSYLFENELSIEGLIEKIKTQYTAMLHAHCRKNKTRWINEGIVTKTKIAFELRAQNKGLFSFAQQHGMSVDNKLKASMENLVLELCDVLDLDLMDDSFDSKEEFELIAGLNELDFSNERKASPQIGKVPFHLQVQKAEQAQMVKKTESQSKTGLSGLAALLAKKKV